MFKPRVRRSRSKDAKIIAKIRSFRIDDDSPASASSVSSSTPSIPYPSPSSKACKPPAPANDNLIPVWGLTGGDVKVFSASVALQLSETPPVAFTFNLTPEGIKEAESYPTGFLDSLKRSFDLELKRWLPGVGLPYWFAIDVDDDGRLHIHGAFLSPVNTLSVLRKIRQGMKAAWGEWEGPGKRKQLRFKTMYSDDWATYCLYDQRKVAKIIGPRTFTITQPLNWEARWAYSEIRRIMREGEK
jgi:hypothetical protein